jgi:hypothetical protein
MYLHATAAAVFEQIWNKDCINQKSGQRDKTSNAAWFQAIMDAR